MSRYIHINDLDADQLTVPDRLPVSVWVPSEAISCQQMVVPDVPRRKWLAMLPWLLEDQLLDDPQNLAFICGKKNTTNRVPILIVAKTCLNDWREQLQHAGVSYQALIPDFFALPWEAGRLSLACSDNRWLLRYGPWQGAAGSPELLWPVIQGIRKQTGFDLTVYTADAMPELLQEQQATLVTTSLAELLTAPVSPWENIDNQVPAADRGLSLSLAARFNLALGASLCLLLAITGMWQTARINAQAEHLEEQLQLAYSQHFQSAYDFDIQSFQDVVARQLPETPVGYRRTLLKALQQLPPVHRLCPDCRIERLAGGKHGVTMALSVNGEPPQGLEQWRTGHGGYDAEFAASGDHWLYRINLEGQRDD